MQCVLATCRLSPRYGRPRAASWCPQATPNLARMKEFMHVYYEYMEAFCISSVPTAEIGLFLAAPANCFVWFCPAPVGKLLEVARFARPGYITQICMKSCWHARLTEILSVAAAVPVDRSCARMLPASRAQLFAKLQAPFFVS